MNPGWVPGWVSGPGPVACWAAGKLACPCGPETCRAGRLSWRKLRRRCDCTFAAARVVGVVRACMRRCMRAHVRDAEQETSRGFEPRSLDSESRVLTVTPRGHVQTHARTYKHARARLHPPHTHERTHERTFADGCVARGRTGRRRRPGTLAARAQAHQTPSRHAVATTGRPTRKATASYVARAKPTPSTAGRQWLGRSAVLRAGAWPMW